jgi:hypothetical protein
MTKRCYHCGGPLECYDGTPYCPSCTSYTLADEVAPADAEVCLRWVLAPLLAELPPDANDHGRPVQGVHP